MAAPKPTSPEHFDAISSSLNELTTQAGDHQVNPKDHLHRPADHEKSHSWLKSLFPSQASLESFENSWHYGNYVIDRQTGQKSFEPMSIYVRVGMHLLYYGTAEEKALHWERTKQLLKDQSEKMGRQYDAPESKDHIQPFIESFDLQSGLSEMKQPDPSKYATFNEFFAREIKESARPIAEPENESVVSSPADCRLTAFPTVDLATKYWIKGSGFTLGRLLGDEALAQKFDGGSLVIARLAPQDYHRWHAPASGKVERITQIPGTYYTVNPQAINEEGTLDVFCENRRSVMVLNRAGTGSPIAVVAVGAMLVGSIKYNEGIQEGADVRRGQCLGAFYYGGSTVIVVYPKGEVTFDEDLVKNSTEQKCETYVKVGWRVGAGPH
ncbi:phosphatidylserine decarboxylase proenzyme 3-like protein [Acrodontium crateriforme]|uniref:phosphatidylserine decarboxylase n=1 Tax=Acrodontium crateriforme TaxID=150365 RepID=A0AAQ3M6W4_9PEZI|nr:phosphatidylserine decarboxylase proenzyme 3-like protein [Acrodontium crateriforme]